MRVEGTSELDTAEEAGEIESSKGRQGNLAVREAARDEQFL